RPVLRMPMQPVLSLFIPAYNEAQRLPPYLAAIRAHFERALPGQYEIIVVDDGSQDGLSALLEDLAADWSELNWLYLQQNQGKGASVRTGVLAAHGELILFADADGATPIEEETKLRLAIEQGADVAIGSR